MTAPEPTDFVCDEEGITQLLIVVAMRHYLSRLRPTTDLIPEIVA